MPIARCCTATRRNCARCARLTGSKRCISRGILGQRLRNARPPPSSSSSSSKMLRSTLSLSLSHLLPCRANLLVRRSPPKRLESTTQSGNAVGPVLSSDLPQHPSSHPFSLFRFTLARSLTRFPHHRQPPLRRFASPTSRARMYPISRSFRLAFFLSFLLSLSFAQREVVFSSRDLSVQHRPLFAAPLLKGVKVLFVSFLLFFLYVMLEFWRDSERSK